MPVEQGLPWHPVATGLAGQAIPFVVAASPAHAPRSPPFWFPVPAVLVASPASLCPSSLSAVLALVPPGVAPAFCVSVLLLTLSVGAPGCPCRAPPPFPPTCPPCTRISHLCTMWTVPCAVGWSWPCCHTCGGHLPAQGFSPRPCGVHGHLVEGGGGGGLLMARSACAAFGGCCSARTSWIPCVLLCVLLGLVSLPCVGRPPPPHQPTTLCGEKQNARAHTHTHTHNCKTNGHNAVSECQNRRQLERHKTEHVRRQ